MKSLEIVNETYEYAYDKKNDCYPFFKREVEIIKQDLEVLEIIKIKKVNLYSINGFLNMHKKYRMSFEDILIAYNLNCPKITMEELLKLKQWLEVN